MTSTISSMTGFARLDGAHDGPAGAYNWTWELRSLNNRGLDVKMRMPGWLDFIEQDLRALVPSRLNRGSIAIALQLKSQVSEGTPRLDEAALESVVEAIGKVRELTDCGKPTADGILGLKGVLVTEEQVLEDDAAAALGADLTTSFQAALEALHNARLEEGARIAATLAEHIDTIERLTGEAKDCAARSPEAIAERLKQQIAALQADNLPEDRLAQEVSMLAVKADVREELDRLSAHIEQARDLMGRGEPIGRKFDFLVQEFNREANTLCSKAQTIELKRIGLELKTVIDQLREQIQNIE